ncbi:hypothetical protein [Chryseobacterium potabilaquae]|uniref:Uncharacterized protein n=1 Tax=Chryseobacterium potabilaquae TaxID=2675057 RepID=A0A6N4XCU5_9FLAO|nr:hypothetical protein [Chryseobacterium potabilaquae]CAA7196842.1 hypothetical protein CHRY9293_02908 [Chryseobacterium potabilaquae]
MIFDTSIPDIRKKALHRVKHLFHKKAKIEVLEKKKNRTYSQNNYLHLILGWYALEYGDTLKEVKLEHFKKKVNPDIFKTEFINLKTGESREEWKSTRDITTSEMSIAIERFRNYSVKYMNLYLPESHDLPILEVIENELELQHNKIYL